MLTSPGVGETVVCKWSDCCAARQHLEDAHMRIVQLDAEITALRDELAEALKLTEQQQFDLNRYKKAIESSRPNCPERTDEDALQLGWTHVLKELAAEASEGAPSPILEALQEMTPPGAANDNGNDETQGQGKKRRRDPHGRRNFDLSKLPKQLIELDPPEVLAAGGIGYRLIGEEASDRVAYRYGGYVHVRLVRRKWVRTDEAQTSVDMAMAGLNEQPLPPVVIAGLPDSFWPYFMADPSAISNVIVSKYGDVLPLNRQETISKRGGFELSRSTMCNWLDAAHRVLYRIVDAMLDEARSSAFCIATDATGAPVKSPGKCDSWHVFVLIADRDHVIFRHTSKHDGAAVMSMLAGYEGYLLADASSVYDVLYRENDVTEAGCWSHARRYFWKAVETERGLAYQALSLISQLFAIERDCKEMSAEERLKHRKARAGPILKTLDLWVDKHRGDADPRGRLEAAITYYTNQRNALHQFLVDGRLSIHNNRSEQALRNLVLGRMNWLYFQNEKGLTWYTVFRSLIASCTLHNLNPQHYLEQVLRLAPHWPIHRIIELAPKYWQRTVERLDERQRAILMSPWEMESQVVTGEAADSAA